MGNANVYVNDSLKVKLTQYSPSSVSSETVLPFTMICYCGLWVSIATRFFVGGNISAGVTGGAPCGMVIGFAAFNRSTNILAVLLFNFTVKYLALHFTTSYGPSYCVSWCESF